jgi:D-lactate dehydrogenase (cytochrome)
VSGDAVTTFEYMHRACIDLLIQHAEGCGDPFDDDYEHYALVELSSSQPEAGLGPVLEGALEQAFEQGIAVNAVIAASGVQREQLWRLRESVPEAQKPVGAGIKHDISVPVSRVPEFIATATRFSEEAIPGCRVIAFGHIGDGNVHFNVLQPDGADPEAFLQRGGEITTRVHDIATELDGSFSAEHGIGVLKKGELERHKSSVELELMRAIKRTLDPRGIMNPGKVL